jgi:ABC-type sugar transport system permease subunit
VIWALHLLICYALVAIDCRWEWFTFRLFDLAGIRVVLLAITLVAAIGVIAGGVVSFRDWRGLRADDRAEERDPTERFRFMTYSGMLLSGLFLLGLLWTIVPLLLYAICPGEGY